MASRHNYRFSVIPGDAVTDTRLEGRDLQVLALLGRHTRNGGWCWRSQVKMAAEIGCGRGTIQRSLDRLVIHGWVDKRPMGRKGAAPDPDKQPFSPYWYRVVLDNVVPEEFLLPDDEEEFDPSVPDLDTCPPVGTMDSGHAGAHLDEQGGAQPRGHESSPLETTPLESVERESARARELKKFKKKYPSAAFDDIAKVDHEWNALPDDDWPKAVPFIEAYLAGLKKLKRTHVPAAWRYLRDRPWNLVNTEKLEENSTYRSCEAWSKEWWAVLFHRADQKKHIDLQVNWARQGKPFGAQRNEWPAEELVAALRPFRSIGPEIDAWRPWLEARGAQLPDWRESIWIFLPSPEPPVAGTPALRTTGPPVAA